MAIVLPFKGIHYRSEKFSDLSTVLSPPYDVISPSAEQALRARSPYNFAHLDLPRSGEDRYEVQARVHSEWLRTQHIEKDGERHFYWYRQQYTWKGATYQRDALVALVMAQDFADRVVRPHENTHGKAKADRLRLMRGMQAQLSHIFGVVTDSGNLWPSLLSTIENRPPMLSGTTDEGTVHSLWPLPAREFLEIPKFFATHPIYIVDGHHRYESSVAFAKETGAYRNPSLSSAFALFSICRTEDPGLIVLPTHRIVTTPKGPSAVSAELESRFEILPMTEESLWEFTSKPTETPSCAVYEKGKLHLYRAKNLDKERSKVGASVADLSVYWSDRVFLQECLGVSESELSKVLQYERDERVAWGQRDGATCVVFQPQPTVQQMVKVADEGKFMPPKSTYFYPKLASGLVWRDFESGNRS